MKPMQLNILKNLWRKIFKMKKYNVEIIEKGIVIGPAFKLNKTDKPIHKFQGIEKELKTLDKAVNITQSKLKHLYDSMLKDSKDLEAEIVQTHILMAEDPTFIDAIKSKICKTKISAYEAVNIVCDEFVTIFKNMDDGYLSQRANDIYEISSQMKSNIVNQKQVMPKEPSIIITDLLTCNDILAFEKNDVLGFVSSKGFSLSHASILARKNQIPTVCGIENIMDLVKNGDTIIISQNELIINPDEETIEEMKIKQIELENFKLELKKNKGLKTQTTDGREIQVLANISSSADLEESIENNCQGVGLFRTEFFFMDKITPPTEEEQYQIYKSVLEKLNGKEVTIRTIDIGSDKPIEYVDYKEENNPALGKRGVRVYLDYLDLFKTQLKALFRASCHGNLRIMYPMIISVKEVKFIYKQIDIVAKELEKEGKAYEIPPQGIMIETPAASLISDELAPLVDFFSIGTNDLTQYTLACDRENHNVVLELDTRHNSILKQIKICVENAHKNGISCSICGELASDESLTEVLLDMGVDKLSVSPNRILNMVTKIREI